MLHDTVSLTVVNYLPWGCEIIPMWKSMWGEETVTQRANHRSYHMTMSFHFSCHCRGRQAIVIWKKSAARSKQDPVPKRDRNCDWNNSHMETALNCQTTLKWLWKGGQMKVKLHWYGPQTILKQRSSDPQTTLVPPTTSKRPSKRSNEPQTHPNNQLNKHTNNYLKRRSDIEQSALTQATRYLWSRYPPVCYRSAWP